MVFSIIPADDIEKCRSGDNACLPGAITKVIERSQTGHSGLNLPSIDPLHINAISIAQGSQSPVSINLELKHQDMYGLHNLKVSRTKGFEKNPNGQVFEVDAFAKQINLIGDYSIDGRVLVLPIRGHGKSNLTLDDLKINIKFVILSTVKNNNVYVQTSKFKLNFDTSRLHIYFENLFNGDKALSDNMNLFLNENWQDILNELKPSFQDAFSQIINSLINGIFAKVAYSDIYLD